MDLAKDYYSVLGVLPTADLVVVRAAYKALIQRYHPDRFAGQAEDANRRTAEINEAYEILSDGYSRAEYDKHHANKAKAGAKAGYAYFSEETADAPPAYDPLEQDWSVAVKYYPSLLRQEAALARISWRLAYSYRAYVLESKSFEDGVVLAGKLANKFLELYFGKNPDIVAFARILIGVGRKPAALALNDAVRVLGVRVDARRVIRKIVDEFDPFGLNDAQGEHFEELGTLAENLATSAEASIEDARRFIELLGGTLEWRAGWFSVSDFHLRLGETSLYFSSDEQVRDWILGFIVPGDKRPNRS
jgi:curved DNA-binding protein CbpA